MSSLSPPIRRIPYGRQTIDEDDIAAVCDVLRSDWLTTGPAVGHFEKQLASFTGASHTVVVSSGTAALHAAMYAAEVGPGDEVIVPVMTFAASANAAVYQGATPVFCDVLPDTLLINPDEVARKITDRTKAIVAVDYAGQPCDYVRLRELAETRSIRIIADGCHSLGASLAGRNVGTLADMTALSFHPVKNITTGEGGAVTTSDPILAKRMMQFRNHGIDTDHRTRAGNRTWFYAMENLGYNYRLTDFQCALGMSQLKKLPQWLVRRREIAAMYDRAFAGASTLSPLARVGDDASHAFHLYVVALTDPTSRPRVFSGLQDRGLGVNVHYIPVHLHPYYQRVFQTGPGQHPVAEDAYERILSLPMYPGMTNDDVDYAIDSMLQECSA